MSAGVEKFDLLAFKYSRLAMATLTAQNFEVAPDGSFYDPQMYRLFMEFRAQQAKQAKEAK